MKTSIVSKTKEKLYADVIDIVLKERTHWLYKDNLYVYLKNKVPGVTRKTYKVKLIELLGKNLTPENLEDADKVLRIRLFLCDLMHLFGFSYKMMKKIIAENNIPYDKKIIDLSFKGEAYVFSLSGVIMLFERLQRENSVL